MAKNKELKTNAMRILDRMKISYNTYSYECDEFTDAQHTADQLGFAHEIMFKTLVTVSPSGEYYVFVLPIDDELDLKKAAHEAGVKSLAMIHVKDITAITGYVRGGCTAIGMKKQYPVFAQLIRTGSAKNDRKRRKNRASDGACPGRFHRGKQGPVLCDCKRLTLAMTVRI